jgi:aldose 1-epimerase
LQYPGATIQPETITVPEPIAPSGSQFEIASGDQRVTVVEVGGGLREYAVGDRPVLDGYAAGEMCSGGRGQILMPWPNRIQDGQYSLGGETYQLALTEPGRKNAIHGLTRWANWRATDQARDRVAMEYVLHPSPGYPFTLALRVEYSLGARGLQVRTVARNAGDRAAPFGMGAHPYLSVGSPRIDADVLRMPAEQYLPTDARGLPTGVLPVGGTPYDFRQARPLGETAIDHAFTGLERGSDGRARVELRAPDGRPGVALWVDQTFPYVQLFTGDTFPDPSRRRRGMAAEPMTCAPNAFRSQDGLVMLQPGETWSGSWGIDPFA